MQPVERDGRSMRSCRCVMQLGNEQNGVISDENRQGIFVFTWFKTSKIKSIYILWNKKAKVSKIMIIFAVVFSRKKFEGQSGCFFKKNGYS